MCSSESTLNLKVNTLRVVRSHLLSAGIREIVLQMPQNQPMFSAGQFYNLGIKNSGGPILKRPISISQVSEEGIHFVIKVLGEGTQRLNTLRVNDQVQAVGPLGNGVSIESVAAEEEVLLIGGGIGVAPLLQLAKEAKSKGKAVTTILGFSETPYMVESFQKYSDKVYLCLDPKLERTDHGTYGTVEHISGTVSEGISALSKKVKRQYSIFACGPEVMLKAIQAKVVSLSANSYFLTEERMACGMGACLVCAKKIRQNDEVKMLRTCIEGPVFKAEEVVFE